MFIAILKYTRPLSEIDALLPAHREYLEQLFQQKKLLLAGRLNPRTGGVLIAKDMPREEFEEILRNDPFHSVCTVEIISFIPTFSVEN